MPRADRKKRDEENKNKKTAEATSQATITSFFKSRTQELTREPITEKAEATPENEIDAPLSACSSESDTFESGPEMPAVIVDPLIKVRSEFNEGDKIRSKNKRRFFQPEWFQKYKWLWYHCEKHAVFCEVCTRCKEAHDISPFIFCDSAPGFCNWKKGTERLADHDRSDNHKAAMRRSKQNHPTIECQLDDHVKEQQHLRRQGLIAHLNTLKTILRQGVAIRGHTDEASNIFQFNKDKAIDHTGLNLLLKENQYMSHDILVEQEEQLVLAARKNLIHDVNASRFYAIICDESSDISKTEQLSFSIRHCNENYEIFEEFIGVMPCDEGLSSAVLLKYIQDILTRCNMSTQKMAGMAFDGASAMKRLAVLVKDEVCKHALYIHCFAHCNELVFKDATSRSRMVADAQNLCKDIYALAGVSPKRVLLFESIQKELSDSDNPECTQSNLKLRNLSRTRWTTRGAAADVMLKINRELQKTLETLSTDVSVAPECRAKARGLLQKLKSFPEMFELVAVHEFAYLLENNSKQLQSACLTAEQATANIDKHYICLQELRSTEEFERLLAKTENITGMQHDESGVEQNTNREERYDEPTLAKRRRTIPAYMTDYLIHSSTPIASVALNEKEELRRIYFEALDAIKEAIETRFNQHDLEVLKAIESCLLYAANNESFSLIEHADKLDVLSEIIDLPELKNKLKELPVHIKLFNKESDVPLRKVTKVATISDVLNKKQSSKESLPEIDKLLCFYHSVPLGSATAERSFSVMRRIKSWLRSRMSANSLNNRMFSTIHKNRIDEVSTYNIANDANEQRRKYFGRFE